MSSIADYYRPNRLFSGRTLTALISGAITLFLSACATEVPYQNTASITPVAPVVAPPPVVTPTTPAPARAEPAPQQTQTANCSQSLYFPGFPEADQVRLRSFACALQTQYHLPEQWVLPALYDAHFNARALALMTPPPPSPVPLQPYPWWRYRNRFLRADRLQRGIDFWNAHRTTIEQVSQQYRVSPEILMGILNIETGFGSFQGNFRVLDANLSLALGLPARRAFFLRETAATIELAHRLGRPVSSLRGSEAGAMGMSQFLASSYLRYGTVWDDPPGEGLPDLWTSVPDVLASTSRFFLAHGWRPGQPVLQEAVVDNVQQAEQLLHGRYALAELAQAGIRPTSGRSMPGNTPVHLLRLATERGPRFFIAYPNFEAIMGYNPSINYSATVWAYAKALRARLG